MLDDSATGRCGPFEIGQYREFVGRRVKITGRSRDALSFTTTPIAFMDLRLCQSLTPELEGQTSYIVVKLWRSRSATGGGRHSSPASLRGRSYAR